MKSYQIIFHIDMNCFFASCEIAVDPSLKGQPIVVARLDPLRKGIILSPSYEARKYGIKTTMRVKDALPLCPQLKVVEPNYELYQDMSNKFFGYLSNITDQIEPASIDEGYLNVTKACDNISAIELANKIQKDLLSLYKLPCSIGIAPNKFLAKMASDMKKPLGITVLRKREIDKLMWPLDISEMFGVGKKTAPRLRAIGINTIGDLANYKNIALLEKTLGPLYAHSLIEKANGIDDSIVEKENEDDMSSIGNSYTFDYNTKDENMIKTTLKVLSNSVGYRLSEHNKVAKTIGIQIKYDDFIQVNRSIGLNKPTNSDNEIYHIVESLYDEYVDEKKDVRLVGVFANRLSDGKEEVVKYSLFDDLNAIEKEHCVENLLKDIQKQFGDNCIKKGK